MLKNTSRET